MRNSKRLAVGLTFAAAAALTFGVLHATRAYATTVLTISSRACKQLPAGNSTGCGVPGGDVIYAAGGISHAYYDYRTTGASTNVTTSLYRQTLSGTIWSDYVNWTDGPGTHDHRVSASQVNVDRSQWDYFFADMGGAGLGDIGNVFGIAIVTK